MPLDRSSYTKGEAFDAAAAHLLEVIRHHREAAAIIQQHALPIALPVEQDLLDAFCECHLKRRTAGR